DADIEAAAVGGAANRFRGTGQICISSTRFLIQRGVYTQFVERFVRATEQLVIGDGMAENTQVGPLANIRSWKKWKR
ncbi:aldehyde dehydrogenase family protein, partial [Klebsiella pneumoniae]|uniref:aldehyde dehydrogenase family protein n=1 Tax=Klebsiella pneumoniae TaxID=573 RepID=UPI0021681131